MSLDARYLHTVIAEHGAAGHVGVAWYRGLSPQAVRRRPVNRLRVRASTQPRVWPALLAAWVLVLTIEAAPHLVHHLLDDDPPTCGFLALLSDTPGLLWRVLDVPPPAARHESVMCRPQGVREHVFCFPYDPRAPPPSCVP
jgi:hypothetical protein